MEFCPELELNAVSDSFGVTGLLTGHYERRPICLFLWYKYVKGQCPLNASVADG